MFLLKGKPYMLENVGYFFVFVSGGGRRFLWFTSHSVVRTSNNCFELWKLHVMTYLCYGLGILPYNAGQRGMVERIVGIFF